MICVFSATANDFTGNGLAALDPTACVVTETLNGEWELSLIHPIDEQNKWTFLQSGNIIKAPVPASSTPRINLLSQTDGRVIYKVSTQRDPLRLRSGTGTSYRALGSYRKNTEVVVVNTANADWYEVICPDGRRGYMSADYLTFVRAEPSTAAATGEVIEAKQLREQPFRIYRVVPELTKVTVYARHIFYDLMDNMLLSYTPGMGTAASNVISGIFSGCQTAHGFTVYTDVSGTVSSALAFENVNPVKALLGEDGAVEVFGGELVRDWYDVYVVRRVGHPSDVEIRQGKNLLGVSYDVDETSVATRILPTGETKDGDLLYLPEVYIDSSYLNSYPHPRWVHLPVQDAKVSDTLSVTQAYTLMRNAAQALLAGGCDLPTISLKVDFICVGDTEEYTQYKPLTDIFLGDNVRVISEKLGLTVSLRMTRYTYDCVLKKYTGITLGAAADGMEGSMISSSQLASGSVTGMKLAMNSVGTGQLQNASVGSLQVKTAAIGSAHIQNAAITTALIADANITTAKIEDAAITAAKIASAIITNAHIADATITTAKIQDAAVTAAKIATATITQANIASASIGTAQIIDAAISAAKIADATVTNAKIADAAINTAKIALGAITTALIDSGAVGTAQIADGSITDAKIVTLTANKINAGTLSVERLIIVGTNQSIVYAINEANGTAQLSSATIDGGSLTQRSITADRIVAGEITANEIAAATILANNIAAGAVTTEKLDANAVTAAKIAANAVTAEKISAGAITTGKVSSDFGQSLDISSNTSITTVVSDVLDAQGTADAAALAHKVQAISGGKVFYYPCAYSANGSVTGYMVITTPITYTYMCRIHLTGYFYYSNASDYELTVSFYAGSSGFSGYTYTSAGNFDRTPVCLAKDAAGHAVIIIGSATLSNNYPKICVDEATITFNTPPDSYKDGWSIALMPDISAYTNLTTVSGMLMQSRITTAESRISTNANSIALRVTTATYNAEKVIRSATVPATPSTDMLWLDTSVSPNILKRYTGSAWVAMGAQELKTTGIYIGSNNVTITTEQFLLQLLDPEDNENVLMEMSANGNVGFKMLYADKVISDSVAAAYNGPTTLTISPEYTGNSDTYFRSVDAAVQKLNNKYLKSNVNIQMPAYSTEVYDPTGVFIQGITGPGKVTINGNSASKLSGYIVVNGCAAHILFQNLSLRESRPLTASNARNAYLVQCTMNQYVEFSGCTLDANGTTYDSIYAKASQVYVYNTGLYNALQGLEVFMASALVYNCKGSCTWSMVSYGGYIIASGTVPNGSRSTGVNGQLFANGVTVDYGTAIPAVAPDETTIQYATLTQSWKGGWRTDTVDLIQGMYSDTGYSSGLYWNRGCMWFGNLVGVLSGTTLKTATLTLYRKTGSGSFSARTVYLAAITNASASGTPAVAVNYGAIGTVGRAEQVTFSIPLSAVQGLAAGNFAGLCLYEPQYNFGSANWSDAYMRMAGTDSGFNAYLRVVYSGGGASG